MKRIITLTLPGEIIFTRLASQTAASAASLLADTSRSGSGSDEFANAFELAISEAFTNSVNYGHKGDEPQTITITFIMEQQQLSVTLRDANPPFSIETPEPDIEHYPEKGYGLMIIRKVMDKVTYCRDNESNIIFMSKQL